MTFMYANPPAEVRQAHPPAQSTVAALAEAVTTPPPAWLRWGVSFGVAALLVAVFAGIMYFIAPPSDQPVTINVPAVAPVPTQAPLDVPSFAEFAGAAEVAQAGAATTQPPPWQPVAYSPAESCELLAHSIQIDPWAKVNWLAVPAAERDAVVQSCGWEVMP